MGSPEGASTEELLDLSILETLHSLGERRGKDLLGQLFGLFQQQGPQGFEQIRSALAVQQPSEIKSVAHGLKGSYRSLGTPRLAEICRVLEEKGGTGDLSGGEALLSELEEVFESTVAALKDFLASKGNA